MEALSRLLEALVGRAVELPPQLTQRYPELRDARYRMGGLPLRVGGWTLGASTVSGITLWRTIWLTAGAERDAELLLHEIRHVQQFQARDRKSTRLNSSHLVISYAVFCLKKKKQNS